VFDTIGLGEDNKGNVPHKKAVKMIRDYFSKCREPLNYIAYVKKEGRITEEERKMFKLFKEIFKGGEENFIIIITHSEPEWVEQNSQIKNDFGDYPIIRVEFPPRHDDEDANKRKKSLQHLKTTLSGLRYNSVRLEFLNSSQSIENKISNVVSFVPIIGTVYQLISSGVYYAMEKPMIATDRLIEGNLGLRSRIAYKMIKKQEKLNRQRYS